VVGQVQGAGRVEILCAVSGSAEDLN
jgi:hypothetical protein